MKHYVVGFLFSDDRKKVVLIEKTHPGWQKGKWNGIGGHIEEGELPKDAMQREFNEEAGVLIHKSEILRYAKMTFKDATVRVYKMFGDTYLNNVISMEEEEVKAILLSNLPLYPIIQNLSWLIPLALEDIIYNANITHTV